MCSTSSTRFLPPNLSRNRRPISPATARSAISAAAKPQPNGSGFIRWRRNPKRSLFPAKVMDAMDEDSMDFPSIFEEKDEVSGGDSLYTMSSSEGEDSDTELIVNPWDDLDLATRRKGFKTPDASLAILSHHFANNQKGQRKRRTRTGVMINLGLISFITLFLLFVDWWSWRIVRLPLEPFYLTHPFSVSAILSTFAGYLYVLIIDGMKIRHMFQIHGKRGSVTPSSKRVTLTMGGLFIISTGITVAKGLGGLGSVEVNGATIATLAYAAIGLLDDILCGIKNHSYGLPRWIKFFLQVAVGAWFSIWLESTNIATPYSMNLLVPLPPPHGLVYLGRFYLLLTSFSFVAVGNGVNLTDGLDGLAGGAAALAFTGMSIAILPICPELAVFGASMAGACVGFLFHNRYKASICMGSVGSLALGGALAACASCTGMFLPLFISSGVFVVELVACMMQVIFVMALQCVYGTQRPIIQMAPLHCQLKSSGLKEPLIVACAYVASCIFALFAGYVGLVSA